MKGVTHVAVGASAPAGLILTQGVTLLQGVTMAAVSAGFALLPDIDTPDSYASKAVGPNIHKLAHGLSKLAFNSTARTRDASQAAWMQRKRWDPYHRTLTHTLAATFSVTAASLVIAWVHPVGAGFLAALGVFLLWPVRGIPVGATVLGALAASLTAALWLSPWLLAIAAGGGYLSHVMGDACTKAGVPLCWPIEIRGKRWWRVRVLGGAVASGSAHEAGPAIGVAVASNATLLFLYF
jgi:membrane-bound metal-dependent hydrolase YbcI (DUF457 family)